MVEQQHGRGSSIHQDQSGRLLPWHVRCEIAYFRPGNLIPDKIPLAALNDEYERYHGEIPRPLFEDRPEEAPEFAGVASEKCGWYIFWHCEVSGEYPQGGLALWGKLELPVFTGEQLRDIRNRGAWNEIPAYQDSTPLEGRMVRGVVGLWLFEMDRREQELG